MARALGRYELLRPLARGGMAEVFLARRRAAGIEKWLVVKRMRPERSGDPRFLDLFVREARLSMSLAHQNIVPVFDFGRIDDQVFLAMERVEGKDLGSSLARAPGHHLPPLLAAFIAAECCQALDYAHQRKGPDGVALGIVHRDVTPRNVLLSWSGEVKLTDFGIAALAGDATSRLLGTPQYMAPEQARSEAIDPRADIYAIGLVLREAITGVRPRPGGDRDAILDAARRGDLVPWPHAPAAPPDAELALGSGDHGEPEPAGDASEGEPPAALVAIIDRATAMAPADRYPDARSMLEALDAFIVADRAARKAESPARQLAAWLAAVWEDARDDAESDAAIQAEHLVSFLDDGAIDVIGTGTVRSMAATAADEAAGDAHPPGGGVIPPTLPTPPSGKPTIVVAPDAIAEKPAALPAAALRDAGARASRISSSTTTVASGSFHTLPASTKLRRSSVWSSRRARSVSSFATLVLVAVAAGGVVFWVMNNRRDRELSGAPTAMPAAPAGAAPTAMPVAAPVDAAPSNTAHADGTSPARSDAGSAAATATGTRSPPAGHAGTSRAIGGPRPDASHGAGSASHAADADRGSAGSAGSDATGSGSDAARPVTCRVRINLTPWAYYTADDDPTQHETPGTIDLTPGRHRLHVWNPELHVERDIYIIVPADRDTMNYSEPLQPSSLLDDAGAR